MCEDLFESLLVNEATFETLGVSVVLFHHRDDSGVIRSDYLMQMIEEGRVLRLLVLVCGDSLEETTEPTLVFDTAL